MKLITAACLLIGISAGAQSLNDEQTDRFQSPNNNTQIIQIANINGDIKVEGYQGTEVMITADRSIKANRQQDLQDARQRIQLGKITRGDTVIYYIKGLCSTFDNKARWKKQRQPWSYNWNRCDKSNEVDYQFDFKVRVPANTSLILSTVNEGDVEVTNVSGNMDICNVNGSISMSQIAGNVYAHTINGDVTADFTRQPSDYNYFYTLNGDIEVNYPEMLHADMTFKSYNGDFFTNVNQLEHQPMKLETNDKEGFKVSTVSLIRLNDGGPRLEFETFNGNVYLKENQL